MTRCGATRASRKSFNHSHLNDRTHEQRRLLDVLNQIVREAEHFRAAEAKSRLITVPTGDGMAQRVMDCGDAGHVLISKHMAEDLEQYGHWKRNLHDLGECEVKHGVRVSVVNLYTEDLGNPEVPRKFRHGRQKAALPVLTEKRTGTRSWIVAAAAIVLIAGLGVGGYLLSRRSVPAGSDRQTVRGETEAVETG